MKRYRKLQIQLTYNVLCFAHRIMYRTLQQKTKRHLPVYAAKAYIIKLLSIPFHKLYKVYNKEHNLYILINFHI